MLTQKQMQEIQDLKLQGYTKEEIIAKFKENGEKVPSWPTINKYYNMDVIPEDVRGKLAKDKAFDVEPFKEAIISILERNQGNSHVCMSSIYDVLEEKFIESGEYETLPGNPQTLRNYIHYLEESGQIQLRTEPGRVYEHVFNTPPGEQALIDFGEVTLPNHKKVHFICVLLRYSRYLCVLAQDHKFSSVEACQALYRCFCRISGRVKILVIDQDAVFVSSETYGEVIKTRIFEDFCTEQDLKLWVCNKADPESKGPIENSVKFVKTNFFSARNITCIDDVWRSLPGWLERKNRRIHQATYMVPEEVFNNIEKGNLRPLLPSVYETSPNSFVTTELKGSPYVLYKSSWYSVPRNYAYSILRYKVVGGKIHIYDQQEKLICSHDLSERKGSYNKLQEHQKPENGDWLEAVERMRKKWNCSDFQHFVNGVKKENPRHLSKQFGAIELFLNTENPDRLFVADVLQKCCEQFDYQYSQFRRTYELEKAKQKIKTSGQDTSTACNVERKDLATYAKAFRDRVEKEAAV